VGTAAGLELAMGKRIWKWFLQGIGMVAPLALTIALLFRLGSIAEHGVGGLEGHFVLTHRSR